MFRGWMQLAFDAQLAEPVTAVDAGSARLVAVRAPDGAVRVFDATCPHRGAHLGHGGVLDGAVLVCPFHGHRVQLGVGCRNNREFRVPEHRAVLAAGGLFVLLEPALDTGLTEVLLALDATHHVVPGFEIDLPVPPEYVIENVVDADHFRSVHAVGRRPRLEVRAGPGGTLRVEGELDLDRPNQWQVGEVAAQALVTRFVAHVHSPTLVITELGPADAAHVVITSATPTAAPGGCRARVTAALPRRSDRPTTVREIASILSGSRTAFAQDALVWEHLDTTVDPRWTPGDAQVRRFREFVQRFRAPVPGGG